MGTRGRQLRSGEGGRGWGCCGGGGGKCGGGELGGIRKEAGDQLHHPTSSNHGILQNPPGRGGGGVGWGGVGLGWR